MSDLASASTFSPNATPTQAPEEEDLLKKNNVSVKFDPVHVRHDRKSEESGVWYLLRVWYLPPLQLTWSVIVWYFMVHVINGRKFSTAGDRSLLLPMSQWQWNQSNATTIISVLILISRTLASLWLGQVAWSCFFFELERGSFNPSHLDFLSNYRMLHLGSISKECDFCSGMALNTHARIRLAVITLGPPCERLRVLGPWPDFRCAQQRHTTSSDWQSHIWLFVDMVSGLSEH